MTKENGNNIIGGIIALAVIVGGAFFLFGGKTAPVAPTNTQKVVANASTELDSPVSDGSAADDISTVPSVANAVTPSLPNTGFPPKTEPVQ